MANNFLRGYSSPHTLGSKWLDAFFNGDDIVVQEKLDGSQVSFGIFDDTLHIRSRKVPVYIADPGMFKPLVEHLVKIQGWLRHEVVYRGEFFAGPRQNTLKYGRAPLGHLVLFDMEYGNGTARYETDYDVLCVAAEDIGVDVVPQYGIIAAPPTPQQLNEWKERESLLGGKIEGVVLKNYNAIDRDGKVLMAKFVSSDFRETHSKEWKKQNPSQGDVIALIIEQVRTEARWRKAVQHLRENGTLAGEARDIGNLIKEVQADIRSEAADEIKEMLWQAFHGQIIRGSTAGLPEWYKEQLAFGGNATEE